MNRQHARPGRYLPPEDPPRDSLAWLLIGGAAIVLWAFVLVFLLPGWLA